MPEIIIDEELAGLIPPLTEDEYSRLEQSILDEGCRDAIILWGNISLTDITAIKFARNIIYRSGRCRKNLRRRTKSSYGCCRTSYHGGI